MATTIACVNQKGGVGKTTTTATVGHSLVRDHGLKVLLVDLDPQASLTRGLIEADGSPEFSMYGVIAEEVPLSEVILPLEEAAEPGEQSGPQVRQEAAPAVETVVESVGDESGRPVDEAREAEREVIGEGTVSRSAPVLHLAPAHRQMNTLVTVLANLPGWASIMAEAIEDVSGDYDVVLVDTRPSLEHLEMLAMSGSDYLIIPVNAAPYAMFATDELMETVRLVRKRTNPALELLGAVITQYDDRNIVCREAREEIEEYFGDYVFSTRIRRNTTLERVPTNGISILDFDPRANGAQDYRALTTEVISRVRG